jgi:hypothetical protein
MEDRGSRSNVAIATPGSQGPATFEIAWPGTRPFTDQWLPLPQPLQAFGGSLPSEARVRRSANEHMAGGRRDTAPLAQTPRAERGN